MPLNGTQLSGPHLIRTQLELGRKPGHTRKAKRDFYKVHAHQLTYFTARRGSLTHIPSIVTIKLLTVLTSLIIRLPSPQKIRGNKPEEERELKTDIEAEAKE
jgi:hypothetical protein